MAKQKELPEAEQELQKTLALIEEAESKLATLKNEYAKVSAEKEELEADVRGNKHLLDGLSAQVNDLSHKKNVLEEEVDDLLSKVGSLRSEPKKNGGAAPGVYLKDNCVFIPGYGHRQKSAGPLSEEELKALVSAFPGWEMKDIKKKFLIVVEEADED